MAEINVIPLVDVVLVLLVIFMVTAPMLYRGMDINLPKSASTDVSAPFFAGSHSREDTFDCVSESATFIRASLSGLAIQVKPVGDSCAVF